MVGVDQDGFKEVDFFNTLGIDPHAFTIKDLPHLQRLRRKAAIQLHPDKVAAPPYTQTWVL